MSEITANLAYNGVRNFEKADENRQQAAEGAAHVMKGLWEMTKGSFGAMGRDIAGHASVYGSWATFFPEMVAEQYDDVKQDMKKGWLQGMMPQNIRRLHAQPAQQRASPAAEAPRAAEPAAADAGARTAPLCSCTRACNGCTSRCKRK